MLNTPAYAAAHARAPLAPHACGISASRPGTRRMVRSDVKYRFVIDIASLGNGAAG